ncbi:MAG: hypothetical protein H7Z43_11930 [Clostridia bacterium]|nr:hypothetical protein [Deltaproteobacteria bacterium]
MVHIEPDFWGYTQSYGGAAPSTVEIAVNENSDCSELPNDAAGFGRCLIKMTRQYAPNTLVGLHASGWASKIDVLMNGDVNLDVSAEAGKTSAWLKAVGAAEGDFIVGDMCDRDAGYYETQLGTNKWWNTNATLPNFTQALTWGKAISNGVGLPLIWWQTPLGNMSQTNKPDHYKDNRVDYLFAHMNDVAASGVVALLFGTGKDDQTEPDLGANGDNGNFVAKVNAYATDGTGKLTCE